MNHDQAHDLLEQYALGTLEPGEHASVELHLRAGCSTCRERMRELLDVSARLAGAVRSAVPPRELKEKILSSAHNSRPSLAPKPNRSQFVNLWLPLVGATAVVALLVWNGQLRRENSELADRLAAYEDATVLLGQPGMEFIDLAGVDPNLQAFGKVVVDPHRGTGVVYMYRLPKTPQGMQYQLWVMREGRPTSAGTFIVGDDGSAVLSLESVDTPAALASFQVTIEPVTGVTEPTGMMYLTGPGESSVPR